MIGIYCIYRNPNGDGVSLPLTRTGDMLDGVTFRQMQDKLRARMMSNEAGHIAAILGRPMGTPGISAQVARPGIPSRFCWSHWPLWHLQPQAFRRNCWTRSHHRASSAILFGQLSPPSRALPGEQP